MSTRRGGDAAKRAFDLAVAVPLAVLTLPVQAAVAVAIRRRLGAPVLFRQQRPGRHGHPFHLVKFRTMHEVDEAAGRVADADRLDAFGAWLRSTSLDELPTLWNVVAGDMSLVGPRPLLTAYLPLYSAEQARRHEVRPGVTGLAQVAGRNALDWDERLRLDVEYVDTRTLALDVSILARTIGTVLSRSGVSAPGHATMPAFTGGASAAGGPTTIGGAPA